MYRMDTALHFPVLLLAQHKFHGNAGASCTGSLWNINGSYRDQFISIKELGLKTLPHLCFDLAGPPPQNLSHPRTGQLNTYLNFLLTKKQGG